MRRRACAYVRATPTFASQVTNDNSIVSVLPAIFWWWWFTQLQGWCVAAAVGQVEKQTKVINHWESSASSSCSRSHSKPC
jgi:hypothetical protein